MKVWDSIDKDLTKLFHQQAATDNPVLVSIRAGARVCVCVFIYYNLTHFFDLMCPKMRTKVTQDRR